MSKNNSFQRELSLTIVEIIETKENFILPKFSYYIFIILLFHQMAGFILSTHEIKPINSQLLTSLAKFNEFSSLPFLLQVEGEDYITIWVFVLIQIFIVSIYTYIYLLTMGKIYLPLFISQQAENIKQINGLIQIFLRVYLWIIFTSFVQFNSGLIVEGQNSLLSNQREDQLQDKHMLFIILAINGLFLTNLTGLIIIYIYRNYKFGDKNLLKRRFHYFQNILLILRFLCILFNYTDLPILKHFFSHIIGISMIFDIFLNLPFYDKEILAFYTYYLSGFEISMICSSIWIYTDYLPEYDIFYIIMLMTPLLGSVIIKIYEIKQNDQLCFSDDRFLQYNSKNLDYTLEQYVTLFQQSENSVSKIQFLVYIQFHIQNCRNLKCSLRQFKFQVQQSDQGNNQNILIQFCLDEFKQACQYQQIKEEQNLLEQYQLKYITLQSDYWQNPLISYFELCKLLNQRGNNISSFFSLISIYLKKDFQIRIQQKFQSQSNTQNQFIRGYDKELDIGVVQCIDNNLDVIYQFISKAIQIKIDFYKELQNDVKNYSQLRSKLIEKSDQILQIDDQVQKLINVIRFENKKSELDQQILFTHIQKLVSQFIQNDWRKALQLDIIIEEQCYRDRFKPQITINNFNLTDGSVVHLQVGLCNNSAEILNKNDGRIVQFFGYDQLDWSNVKQYKQLMTPNLAKIHDKIISKYIENKGQQQKFSQRTSILRYKNKFLMPVTLDLKILFGLTNDVVFQMTILKQPDNEQLISFNEKGRIIGFTQELFIQMFFHKKQYQNVKKINELYEFLISKGIIEIKKLLGFIFLFFTEICEIFTSIQSQIHEQISKHDNLQGDIILQNLKCKIQIPSKQKCFIKQVQSYIDNDKKENSDSEPNNQFMHIQKPLLTRIEDLKYLKEKIQRHFENQQKNQQQFINILCTLNLKISYQNFEVLSMNINQKEWVQMKSDIKKQKKFIFFVMDVKDTQILKQKLNIAEIYKNENEKQKYNSFQSDNFSHISQYESIQISNVASEILHENIQLNTFNKQVQYLDHQKIPIQTPQNLNYLKIQEKEKDKKDSIPLFPIEVFPDIISPRNITDRVQINIYIIKYIINNGEQEIALDMKKSKLSLQQEFFQQEESEDFDEQDLIKFGRRSVQSSTNSSKQISSIIMLNELQETQGNHPKKLHYINHCQILFIIFNIVGGFIFNYMLDQNSQLMREKVLTIEVYYQINYQQSQGLIGVMQSYIQDQMNQSVENQTSNVPMLMPAHLNIQCFTAYIQESDKKLLEIYDKQQQFILKIDFNQKNKNTFEVIIFEQNNNQQQSLQFLDYYQILIHAYEKFLINSTDQLINKKDLIKTILINYQQTRQLIEINQKKQVKQYQDQYALNFQSLILVISCNLIVKFLTNFFQIYSLVGFFFMYIVNSIVIFENLILNIHQKSICNHSELYQEYNNILSNINLKKFIRQQIQVKKNVQMVNQKTNSVKINQNKLEKTKKYNKTYQNDISLFKNLKIFSFISVICFSIFVIDLFMIISIKNQENKLVGIYFNYVLQSTTFNQLLIDTNILSYRLYQKGQFYNPQIADVLDTSQNWIEIFNKDIQVSDDFSLMLIFLQVDDSYKSIHQLISFPLCELNKQFFSSVSEIFKNEMDYFCTKYDVLYFSKGLIQLQINVIKLIRSYQQLLVKENYTEIDINFLTNFVQSLDFEVLVQKYFTIHGTYNCTFIIYLYILRGVYQINERGGSGISENKQYKQISVDYFYVCNFLFYQYHTTLMLQEKTYFKFKNAKIFIEINALTDNGR